MTQKEIKSLLGEPKYRRFNEVSEEWEYQKNPLSDETTVIIINIINDQVVNMNSFKGETVVHPPVILAPTNEAEFIPPIIQQPNHRPNGRSIYNEDFQKLYNNLKKKPFKDDQLELLNIEAMNNYFTCKQELQLMSLYTFDNDKLKVLNILASRLVDKQNYEIITESLTFSSNKDKAKILMGIPNYKNNY
ncbi:DUF4476 domain-containing protein [Barnesiella propionica]|uniref:DUF4476 domain-containing protein n=1 Tax=Barnesiella propionica TaxID=2981781 RepID=UPI0021D3D836|nr:DUF4476 domain-containing protein [Barnesiella propionica]